MTEKKRGRIAGVKTTPPNETKQGKFKRLAEKRLNKSLKAIKQLKNLSTSAYESKPEQVIYIIEKLGVAVEDVKKSFSTVTTHEPEKIEIPA